MRIARLLDGVFLKFAGFALVKSGGNQYYWSPRYDQDGYIYAWIRDARSIKQEPK